MRSQVEAGEAAARVGLIGAWRLVSCAITAPDGEVSHPYGEAPAGVILYTPDGWMSCHMQGARFEGAETRREDVLAYTGYYGAYTVVEAERLVVHHVAGSSEAIMSGDQLRYYEIEGVRLRLTAEMNGLKVDVRWARPS